MAIRNSISATRQPRCIPAVGLFRSECFSLMRNAEAVRILVARFRIGGRIRNRSQLKPREFFRHGQHRRAKRRRRRVAVVADAIVARAHAARRLVLTPRIGAFPSESSSHRTGHIVIESRRIAERSNRPTLVHESSEAPRCRLSPRPRRPQRMPAASRCAAVTAILGFLRGSRCSKCNFVACSRARRSSSTNSERAPAGPGVLLLTDSDLTSYYYVEACQTLRIAIPAVLRGGASKRRAAIPSSRSSPNIWEFRKRAWENI